MPTLKKEKNDKKISSPINVKVARFSLQGKRQICEGTWEIAFDTGKTNFTFRPGQYLRLTLPFVEESVQGGNTRDFTISSSPNSSGVITISFRESESAFKRALLAAKKGTVIRAQGPLGVFTLPVDATRPLVFVAGGIGVTPFLSMINFSVGTHEKRSLFLIYSNTSETRSAYLSELRKMNQDNKIKLIEHIGPLDIEFLKKTMPQLPKNALWYICGVPSMVSVLKHTIPEDLGISENQIRIEEYVGYESAPHGYKIPSPVSSYPKARYQTILGERLTPPTQCCWTGRVSFDYRWAGDDYFCQSEIC